MFTDAPAAARVPSPQTPQKQGISNHISQYPVEKSRRVIPDRQFQPAQVCRTYFQTCPAYLGKKPENGLA
jgi:hypothetical protein